MAIQNIIQQVNYKPLNQASVTNVVTNNVGVQGATAAYLYNKGYGINNAIQQKIYVISQPATKAIEDKLYSVSSALQEKIYLSNSATKNAINDQIYRMSSSVNKSVSDQIYRTSQATSNAIRDSVYRLINNLTYEKKVTPVPPITGIGSLTGGTLTKEEQKVRTIKEIPAVPTITLSKPLDNIEGINPESNETNISEQTIPAKYFNNVLQQVDRRSSVKEFSYDYLSYLFFKSDINIVLNEFYLAVGERIANNEFWSPESSEKYNDMDEYLVHYVFSQIWNAAINARTPAIKNIVGFYIYFNERLSFFDILIQGVPINEFINNMTLTNVLNTLTALGLYPLNIGNLFNRLWYSYKLSANQDGNKAEVMMSINEFYKYRVNRLSAATHDGFPDRIDNLRLSTKIDIAARGDKVFSSSASAFNTLRDLDYNFEFDQNNAIDVFLTKMIPVLDKKKTGHGIKITERRPVVYQDGSLLVSNREDKINSIRLWNLLESFNNDYKISTSYINKDNIEALFRKFSQDKSFPIGEGVVDINKDYITFWFYWMEYLNYYVNNMDLSDYENIFDKIIELVNIRFLIKYLDNNNAFKDLDFEGQNWKPTDKDNYVLAKLQELYSSLDSLKTRTKKLLREITITDKRFFLV